MIKGAVIKVLPARKVGAKKKRKEKKKYDANKVYTPIRGRQKVFFAGR